MGQIVSDFISQCEIYSMYGIKNFLYYTFFINVPEMKGKSPRCHFETYGRAGDSGENVPDFYLLIVPTALGDGGAWVLFLLQNSRPQG